MMLSGESSFLIESEAKLRIVILTRFLHANHYLSGQVRRHAPLENTIGTLETAAERVGTSPTLIQPNVVRCLARRDPAGAPQKQGTGGL